jgi:ribosomal protein S18 acetylase RimI-like enzyme
MLQVRRATENDQSFIVDFQLAMALETEAMQLDKPTVQKGVANVFTDSSKGVYYVAELNKKIIGGLLTTFEWSDWRNGTVLWIHSLYIVPEHRGKGYFRQMYSYLREFVQNSTDYRGLRLYVEKNNASAQGVYKKLGMSAEHYDLYEWLK